MGKIFFDKINSIRKKKKITLAEIAEAAGISRSTIWKWEKGVKNPKDIHIREIAKVLSVSVDEISDLPAEKPLSNQKLSDSVETWFELTESGISEENSEFKRLGESLKKIQNKLEHSSLIIKGLMNATNSYLYIKGTDSKYIIANRQFKKGLSLDLEFKIYKKTDHDLFSVKEALFNKEEDKKAMLLGTPVINREGFIPGSRKKKWGMISKIPIFDSKDRIQGIIGIFVDITERKRNEELRELLEVNVNSMSDGIAIMNINSNEYVYLNNAREKLYGYSNSLMIKKGFEFRIKKFVHPDDRAQEQKYYLGKKWPATRNFRIIKPDGETRWIECISSQTVFMGKKSYFSIQRDITEKVENKKLQEEYIHKINDMENALLNLPYLVYVHRKTGDILAERNSKNYFTNGNEYLIIGVTENELNEVGKNWVNFIIPGYRQKIIDIMNSDKKNVEIEYPIKSPKTKKIRWLKESYTVYSDKVCGIVHDITELKIIGGVAY
ncbi:MAG TPA: PAS domain S-box protein [Victivallales bacterium]|nr:PAS domain S-box protein [Victivallales bacterium]